MQKRSVFIHFQPLELYPPVMNMINFVKRDPRIVLYVITNRKAAANSLSTFEATGVRIIRIGKLDGKSFSRYINYLKFYFISIFLLIKYKPFSIIYFETLSSFSALFYKKFIRRSVRLMVHYHEYSGPAEYKNNMALARWMHRWEKKIYQEFSWISQTNSVRMQMFKQDNGLSTVHPSVFKVMPNYPPKSWIKESFHNKQMVEIVKLVYVGSLGYDNMYLKEVLDWVCQFPQEVSLDIYSFNIQEKAKRDLERMNYSNVHFYEGCNYFDLPKILNNYDVGLDMYKPYALNHIHGISNKVFEYLACGLDVWFSIDKPLTSTLVREGYYPQVIGVNFNNLTRFDYKKVFIREGLKFKSSSFFCENIYPELVNDLLNE